MFVLVLVDRALFTVVRARLLQLLLLLLLMPISSLLGARETDGAAMMAASLPVLADGPPTPAPVPWRPWTPLGSR